MSLGVSSTAAVQQSYTPGTHAQSDATQFTAVPLQSRLALDMYSDAFSKSGGGDVSIGDDNFSQSSGTILQPHPPSSAFTFRFPRGGEAASGPSGTVLSFLEAAPSPDPGMLMLEKIIHDQLNSMEALDLDMRRVIMAVQLFNKHKGRLSASECEAVVAGMEVIPPEILAQYNSGLAVAPNGTDDFDAKVRYVAEESTPSECDPFAEFLVTLQQLEQTASTDNKSGRSPDASDYSVMSVPEGDGSLDFAFMALPMSTTSSTKPPTGGSEFHNSLFDDFHPMIYNDNNVSQGTASQDTRQLSPYSFSYSTTTLTQAAAQAGTSVSRERSTTSDSGYDTGSSLTPAIAVSQSTSRKRKRSCSKKSGMTIELDPGEAPPPKRIRGNLEIIRCCCKLADGTRCPQRIVAQDSVEHWRDVHSTLMPETAHLHHEHQAFVCGWPGCGEKFKSDNVRNHFGRVHYKLTERQCPQCGKKLSQTSSLNKHLKRCPKRPREANVTGTHP